MTLAKTLQKIETRLKRLSVTQFREKHFQGNQFENIIFFQLQSSEILLSEDCMSTFGIV